jgi:hypothetical protein
MAKVFYVINHNEGEGGVDFFKTEKEALAYGKEQSEQFELGKEVENENGTVYTGDVLTFKKGILFSYEEDGTKLQAIEDADARQYVEALEDMGSAVFFEGFVKGMYCFLGRDVQGKGMKWNYLGDGINENEIKSSFKHMHTFESFVNTTYGTK